MNARQREYSVQQAARQKVRPVRIEQRVTALLTAPFSPEVREHTIGELLADATTRDETLQQLGYQKHKRELNSESRGT